jgi:hypothetical protein
MTFSRIRLALATAVAAVIALTATPSVAAATDVPAFAFDDCPAIPTDVDRARWRCEEMHASGSVRVGDMDLPVTMKTTHAEGRRSGDTKTQFIFGALRADPVSLPGGLLGLPGGERSPVLASSLTLEYAGHIDFVAGPPMAEILHLKYRLTNPLLAETCYLGTDQEPIKVVGTIVSERVPVPENPRVLTFTVEDEAFAVPASRGCGPFGPLVDRRFDLPSMGSLRLTVYFSIKTYDKI